MKLTQKIIISGSVQGVGFRQFTLAKARERNLCGWVRNLPTGEVEILVQGDPEAVKDFLDTEAAFGPSAAQVNGLNIEKVTDATEYNTFEITH